MAAAGADRRQAEAAAVSPELVDHRREDARSRGADWVAECDGPAVQLTLSGSVPSIAVEFRTTDEKASFSSTRSTSSIDFPAFSSACRPASAGVLAR